MTSSCVPGGVQHRRFRALVVALLVSPLGACSASFTSESDAGGDLAEPADLLAQGETDAGPVAPDLAGAPPDLTPPPQGMTIAQGSFTKRRYNGQGTAQLYRRPDGRIELRFSSDFKVDGVPGPIVLLSSRSDIGSSGVSSSTDISLGKLQSTSGAQAYLLPASDGGRRYAWVYCEPFKAEVSRAQMAP